MTESEIIEKRIQTFLKAFQEDPSCEDLDITLRRHLRTLILECKAQEELAKNGVYSQRNALAILAAFYAGNKGGWGEDPDHHDWDRSWKTVVFIELPNGEQISYHMGPLERDFAERILPMYRKSWDGTRLGEFPADLLHRLLKAPQTL